MQTTQAQITAWPRPLIPIKLAGRDVLATAAFELGGRWHFRWDKLGGNPSPKPDDVIEYDGEKFQIISGKASIWHDYVAVAAVPVDAEPPSHDELVDAIVGSECRTVDGAA